MTKRIISTSPDGLTVTYVKDNRRFTVTRAHGPAGFYPGGSRVEAYRGAVDRRHSPDRIAAVQEARRAGQMGRDVKPGPQSW